MKIEIRICGLGGQGVVLAGQILGRAAVYDGKYVVQTQSYGAEARGGMAKSEVIISNSKIGYPAVRKCDVLVAMTQEALDRNFKDLKENGTLITDKGLVQNTPQTEIKTYSLPITQTSSEMMREKLYANIVMLGALIKITGMVEDNLMKKAIEYTVPKRVLEANLSAYNIGKELVTSLHRE
jgi:2-oxoglutarate ferredoxin oxidoreductase subunit gamma